MRIVVAPQEFKGSFTAVEAAAAIAEGVRRALPDITTDEAPLSDGGGGLVDAMLRAAGGEPLQTLARDPLMRQIPATWALLADGAAVVEMAAASGLVLLREEERAPLIATTYGTGELIVAALDRGATSIFVGAGGSATVDAGAGAMQALGARLLDANGGNLTVGGAALARLDRIDLSARDVRLAGARITVLTDVTNVLCGPEGAAAMFGPQKGAAADDVRTLDAALGRFAEVARRDCEIDVLALPGGGAAGGLGAGLAVVADARITRGFPVVAEAARLAERIANAHGVITGEGRLDRQTAFGKAPLGVAAIAREQGKPVVVIVGSVEPDYGADAYTATISLAEIAGSAASAMRGGAAILREAGARAARLISSML
jgi:glycerate kinase